MRNSSAKCEYYPYLSYPYKPHPLVDSPDARALTYNLASTDEAAFSSAAAQLISLYIPPSVASAIASAAAAATVTGDPASIVQDALTATSPPPWLSAVPSEYAPNLSSLDSAVEALRGYASTGIDGASRIVTVTDEAGSTLITIVPGSVAVTGSSAEATATGTETDGTASSGATGSATTGSGAPTTSMTGEVSTEMLFFTATNKQIMN